jgi:hypothetical protein
MADLNLTLKVEGSGLLSVTGIERTTSVVNLGTSDALPIDLSLGDGTGDSQGNQWYFASHTLAATTGVNLDLTALANALGSVAFTKIRHMVVILSAPDGTKVIRVGPQNETNGWQGPFPVVTANGWFEVRDALVLGSRYADGIGAVSGTNKILRLYNPGAGSVTVQVWLIGVA